MSIESVTLHDEQSGARARILAGFGFNCFELTLMHNDRPLELLWSASGFDSGQERPSGSGIPLLFPFPGRLRGAQLQWAGKRCELSAGDGRGNAIHGFVHERPWRVIESTATEATGLFQASVDDPRLLDRWPADFRITLTYRLGGNSLAARVVVENPDSTDLPFGLGAHPYFRVPLGGGSGEDCVVTVPAAEQWEMVDMIATGKTFPVSPEADLRGGKRFGDTTLDNGFSKLTFNDGWCAASIVDHRSGAAMTLRFDSGFRECVVYNPPHREAICIEPYTCICDPFRLADEGFDAGLRVLAPGGRFEANFVISLG